MSYDRYFKLHKPLVNLNIKFSVASSNTLVEHLSLSLRLP